MEGRGNASSHKSRRNSDHDLLITEEILSGNYSEYETNNDRESDGSYLRPPLRVEPQTTSTSSKSINMDHTVAVQMSPQLSSETFMDRSSRNNDSHVLSVEEDELQDFKVLQRDVRNLLVSDKSEWLRKPTPDQQLQRESSTAGSRDSLHNGISSNNRNSLLHAVDDGFELNNLSTSVSVFSHEHHQTPNQSKSAGSNHSLYSTDYAPGGYNESENEYTVSDTDAEENVSTEKHLLLYGRSLGFFPPSNVWRLRLASVLLNKWYNHCSMLVLVLYIIFLSYGIFYGSTSTGEMLAKKRGTAWYYTLSLIFNSFFTFEVLAKTIAFGFWNDSQLMKAVGKRYKSFWEVAGIKKFYKHLESHYSPSFIHKILPIRSLFEETADQRKTKILKSSVTMADLKDVKASIDIPRAFARSSWGRLELLSTVSAWLAFSLSFNGFDDRHGLRLFKALMAFRILRIVELDSGLVSILRALKYGLPELLNVGFMLLYFWTFFAILGVQTFRGSLKRQCVWFNPEDPNDNFQYSMQFCGGYLNATTMRPEKYIFLDNSKGPASKGFLCPANSKCISNANPFNGRISFDNIVNSMQLVFVIMSANTFTDLMYYMMDSDNMAASLFFIVSIFVLTVWMVNLLIAVLYSSFEVVQEKFRDKEFTNKHNLVVGELKKVIDAIQQHAKASKQPRWAERGLKIYRKFEWLFVTGIFVAICALASIKNRSDPAEVETIFLINRVVAYLLVFETVLRLVLHAKTPWLFLQSPNYLYDSVISVLCLVLSVESVQSQLGEAYNWLMVFPISRFYRVIMIFNVTRNLWKKVLKNVVVIWNLSAFYFLFVFLASLIVLLYFDGTLSADDMGETPYGFYSLPNSFLTLFIIGSTENWTDSLYALQQESQTLFSAFFGSMLMILWFILSNFVVLNVFVAVIAASFDVKEEDKRTLQITHYLKVIYPEKIKYFNKVPLLERIKRKLSCKSPMDTSNDFKQFLFRGTAIFSITQNYKDFDFSADKGLDETFLDPVNEPNYIMRIVRKLKSYSPHERNPFFKDPEVVFVESDDSFNSAKKATLKLNEWEAEKLEYLKLHPNFNNSYFIFPPNHALRRFCQRLVPSSYGKRTNNKAFYDDISNNVSRNKFFFDIEKDIFVAVTFVATLLMVIYSCYVTPLYRMNNVGHKSWITFFEPVFVPIFTLEFIVKTIADGFIYSPNAYLMNPWNRIDLVVLVALWIDFIAWLVGNGELARIIKAVSALRALRFLTISNMARITFKQVMFDGVSYILGACAVAFSILFPYTVWGLVIFRGRLGVCNDGDLSYSECYNEFVNEVFKWDILMPRVYSNPILHLDSFTSAFRSMYEIVSLEGWTDLLENIMSSTGIGSPAELFASPFSGIFLVLFNFLSMVFILNIFVSFIVGNNSRLKGTAYLTLTEKSWLEVKRLLSQVQPDSMPNVFTMSSVRRFCFQWAVEKNNFYFSAFMQTMLYLHILTLLLLKDEPYGGISTIQSTLFMITTTFLLLQEVMHIYGQTLRLYIRKRWNIYRFVVLVLAFITNVYQLTTGYMVTGLSNARDVFQLGVFLLVIPQNDILNELINTATASLPSIFSLIYTWFILFLVYAIALNQVFGLTKLGPDTTGNINCRTVTKALILLFRCSFGEGWNYIMHDLTLEKPFCYSKADGGYTDCGSKTFAYALLMSWNILSMYIFVNMFISLIVDKFSYVYHREQNRDSPASREEIRSFKFAWRKLDPDGVGELEISYLPKFMHLFDGPLSFKIWEGRLTVKSLLANYFKVNPEDPYDVEIDYSGLNKELSSIDYEKVNQRRLEYRRFVYETQLESNKNDVVKFSKLIELVPLYTTYNKAECLGIDDYVKSLYNLHKIDKLIENERNFDVLLMVVARWKFILRKRKQRNVPILKIQPSSSRHFSDGDEEIELKSPALITQETNFMWSPSQKNPGNFGNHSERTIEDSSRPLLINDTSDEGVARSTSPSSSLSG